MIGFLTYAIATAAPQQQSAIIDGTLAIKDAVFEACTREDSICARAIQYISQSVSGSLTEGSKPWMDEEGKRPRASGGLSGAPTREKSAAVAAR